MTVVVFWVTLILREILFLDVGIDKSNRGVTVFFCKNNKTTVELNDFNEFNMMAAHHLTVNKLKKKLKGQCEYRHIEKGPKNTYF